MFVLSCLKEVGLGRYLITVLLMDECDGTVLCAPVHVVMHTRVI